MKARTALVSTAFQITYNCDLRAARRSKRFCPEWAIRSDLAPPSSKYVELRTVFIITAMIYVTGSER